MFESINNFVIEISEFKITLPLEVQIGFIIIILIALSVGAYFLRDMFNITTMRNGFSWFIFIAILNLTSILVIFLYYNTKKGTYIGKKGAVGEKGKMGEKGTSISCNFNKSNIYLEKVRQSTIIARIDTIVKAFIPIFKKEKYFNDILEKGNNIDYDSFIKNIILVNSTTVSERSPAIDNFNALMDINSIAILLIKTINKMTKASTNTYGTFRFPIGNVGYIPLGNSVYGGIENDLQLNSFMIDGNILYPSNYKRIVSFSAHNEQSGDVNTYTIWRATGQTINEQVMKTKLESVTYSSLGDICKIGTNQPKDENYPTVSMKCLQEIDPKDLILVFIYVGNIDVPDEKTTIDYTKSESYLIENEKINNIEIFSVWRTPLNTFLTNSNSENEIINNTVLYNIINNIDSSLNKYGNVSIKAKKHINNVLKQIYIPKIVISLILCKYYEIELLQDIIYYINRYIDVVPEFREINISTSTFGDLMNKIVKTKQDYEDYNDELMRKANFKLKGKKILQYDEKKEKHLPTMILRVYETANTKLLTIPIQIENTNTLLDIVNLIFENGIETKIAMNSDGVAQGGVFMNSIQEMILRICKIIMPPKQPAYTIKDECLGTFVLDREREEHLKLFNEAHSNYLKLLINFYNKTEESEQSENVTINLKQYYYLMETKIGQLCGHIKNYKDKIYNGNMEEFTLTRIKGLLEIYNNMNSYLTNIISKQ